MKTAIKLILIYLGIQLVCGGLIGIPFTIIARMNGGSVDATRVSELTLAPSMLLSMAVMFFYLWKAHYIPKDKTSWSFFISISDHNVSDRLVDDCPDGYVDCRLILGT